MTALIGFATALSLIFAIGAQNAFVLRQGLRRSHVLLVCLTCALSDAILIVAGIAGFAAVTARVPWLPSAMAYGGAAFLVVYGLLRLRAAWRGGETLQAAEGRDSAAAAVAATLAFTWLNPHVYLDTLALLGAISTGYPNKVAFGAGAVTASFTFFFALGYGARALAPVMARPGAWRVLDTLIGLTMLALAAALLWSAT